MRDDELEAFGLAASGSLAIVILQQATDAFPAMYLAAYGPKSHPGVKTMVNKGPKLVGRSEFGPPDRDSRITYDGGSEKWPHLSCVSGRQKSMIGDELEAIGPAASGSLAIVILQQATDTLPAMDLAGIGQRFRLDQLVSQSLVVSFPVVMGEVLLNDPFQIPLAEDDQTLQAL